jgi:hypothetical protein
MIRARLRQAVAASLALGLALALTGCLLSPGTFTSRLELRKDRTFAYSYDGEIHLLALSKLAAMGERAEQDNPALGAFEAQPCYDEESFEERECTSEEVAEQERGWKEAAAASQQNREREAEMMRAMLGGIDPSDPAAAAEVAERLQRQKGWNKVVHKGDGLFEVSFAIAGPLQHDFLFPVIERFPMANQFVQVVLREDGTARVDAPGFTGQPAGSPFPGMMAGMAGAFSTTGNLQDDDAPPYPAVNGTFVLVTDGEILANNTDEGPRAAGGNRTLEWRINPRTQTAPMALIKLGG